MKTAQKVVLAGIGTACCGAGSALAQDLRCDCTSVVDTCTANVEPHGTWLDIKSDRKECSRVDYFVDGLPFVSVVVDGEDRRDWTARTTAPKILVQSCQVCRDNTIASKPGEKSAAQPAPAATDGASSETGEKKLEPVIAGTPEYPPNARARRLEGHVDVEFTITPLGTVENARVVDAEPRNVFNAAALAAVNRWRYTADPNRAAQTTTERVEFKLPAQASAAQSTSQSLVPRNQCVRQNAVYNYGEEVDVGLINACSEPVYVSACAEGTGKYASRWVCTDSDDQGRVLVGADDRRLGDSLTLETTQGERTYHYADSFSVTRAPNAPYWWIACAPRDTACRSASRQWTRALAGQSATVDPQDRSPIAIAQSR